LLRGTDFRDCAGLGAYAASVYMNFYVRALGPVQTNAYLLTEPERGEAVLIDAPEAVWAEVAPLLAHDKCRLSELWLTHGHWDHMQGAAEVVRESGAQVLAHSADQPLYEEPERMRSFMFESSKLEPVGVDRWVGQGEAHEALGLRFEVRHVPGHCPGNILFYAKALRAAFVGDALFRGSVGRTDLPGGDFEALAQSIRQQIYTLPAETRIYSGHGPETNVAAERATNPYVHD